MVLKSVYIVPHGEEIITMNSSESARMNMEIKNVAREDNSNTLLVISPHSIRLSKMIGLVNTEYLRGRLRLGNKNIFQLFRSDRQLNKIILNTIEWTEEVIFITSEGKSSVFPLDFGSMIPLYFFGKRRISLIGQSRLKDRDKMVEFGRELYRVTMEYGPEVSIILSADQAHTHSASGPYGYSEYARYYDELVVRSVKDNNFENLLSVDDDVIEKAKTDSYWNMLTFFGIIDEGKLEPKYIYYYIEKYFGMMFAYGISKYEKTL